MRRHLVARPSVLAGLAPLSVGLASLLLVTGARASMPGPAATAAGTTFTVDSTGDEGDLSLADPACATATGTCTLRAAVEEANATTAADTVGFAGSVTNKSITLGAAISITRPLALDGCSSKPASADPCVGLRAQSTSTDGLAVAAPAVTIRGLAIAHARRGITAQGTGLVVGNSWLGLRVDGGTEGDAVGVVLNGSGAAVGGTSPAERNVFAGNGTGLKITGGDDNVIRGNYFGTRPDGETAAPDSVDIVTSSTPGDVPEDNVIGGSVGPAAVASPQCDDACNLIAAGGSMGISLAPGPTRILGNFVGLDASGTTALGNSADGVGIDFAPLLGVTIGGPDPGDRNVISGNATGIIGGDCCNDRKGPLVVQGNYLGLRSDGASALPNSDLDAQLEGTPGEVTDFVGNRTGGDGAHPEHSLVLFVSGTRVQGNVFGVGTGGQTLPFAGSPLYLASGGTLVGGNTDAEANVVAGGGAAGLTVGGRNMTIKRNFIGVDAGGVARPNAGPGILVSGGGSNITIGGSTSESENRIAYNAGPAIDVAGSSSHAVSIGRNTGTGAAPFIDLGDDGKGNLATGPNKGIQPPVITEATTTGAAGAAPAGSRVRLYLGKPGKIQKFVATATADAGGAWTVTYPVALAAGQRVAATQSVDQGPNPGTSELSPLHRIS